MIDRDELKRFLLHEERSVRGFVAEYFSDSWAPDEDLMPLVLAACRRYGDEDNKLVLYHAGRFALTDESLPALLQHLKNARDVNVAFHLNHIVARAPVTLLAAREPAVMNAENVLAETRKRIERRRELAEQAGEEVWAELQAFSERSRDKKIGEGMDLAYGDDLVEALARHDTPDAKTLCRLLDSPEVKDEWLEVFLIDLAGARNLREAIPLLVGKFRVDADYMLERTGQALARIGDPEAVRLIREPFAEETWDFKLYTSGLLGNLKHPASEEAILAVLAGEDDDTVRTYLCRSLCNLLSERAIDVVQREIGRGYARAMLSLEELLLDVAQIFGVSLPEEAAWRAEREERRRRQAARQSDMAKAAKVFQDMIAQGVDPLAHIGPPSPAEKDLGGIPKKTSLSGRRGDARIGRNDPCPCGSGRKYKRCCGRKS